MDQYTQTKTLSQDVFKFRYSPN